MNSPHINFDPSYFNYEIDTTFKNVLLPDKWALGLPIYLIAYGRVEKEHHVCRNQNICYLVYSEKGSGRANTEKGWVDVPEGDAVFFPAGSTVEYAPLGDEDWQTVFFTFAGRSAENLLKRDIHVFSGFDLAFISDFVNSLYANYHTDEHLAFHNATIYHLVLKLSLLSEDNPSLMDFSSKVMKRVTASIKHVNEYFSHDLSVAFLASQCGLSETHYSVLFKKQTGMNFVAYINTLRLNHACDLISKDPNKKLSEIAEECGFRSQTYFNTMFKRHTGLTPSEYRAKG